MWPSRNTVCESSRRATTCAIATQTIVVRPQNHTCHSVPRAAEQSPGTLQCAWVEAIASGLWCRQSDPRRLWNLGTCLSFPASGSVESVTLPDQSSSYNSVRKLAADNCLHSCKVLLHQREASCASRANAISSAAESPSPSDFYTIRILAFCCRDLAEFLIGAPSAHTDITIVSLTLRFLIVRARRGSLLLKAIVPAC
jgi:hypothetical protein